MWVLKCRKCKRVYRDDDETAYNHNGEERCHCGGALSMEYIPDEENER